MKPTTATFREWVKENLSEELRDIANHGADAGYPHITYTSDCVALHDEYQEELWDMMDEDAEEFGHKSIPEFMGTWNRKDMLNDLDQMKNMIVWYAVEKIANEEA